MSSTSLLLVVFIIALSGPGSLQALEVSQEDAAHVSSSISKVGDLVYKSSRWNNNLALENLNRNSKRDQQTRAAPSSGSGESGNAALENEISTGQRYACGRALSGKKHYEKHSFELNSSSRSKYRPFEIRTPRIIGGDETNPGEFPWTVSVKLNGQPICGGSLISRSWILTAAHCVVGYNPKNLTVRLGAYRIKDTSEQQVVDSPISLFIVHKQYSMPRPFSNDIALLKMAEPIEYSDFIIPICLPTEDQITSSSSSSSSTSSTTSANNLNANHEIATDYQLTKVFGSAAAAAGSLPPNAEDFDTSSEGIVVSTKMSDKEISKCFKRLEQNYLNSIGLGTTSGGANSPPNADEPAVQNAPPMLPIAAAPLADEPTDNLVNVDANDQRQQQQQQKRKNYLMPPIPIDLIPTKVVTSQFLAPAADSNSQLGPMFVTTNNNNNNNNNENNGASAANAISGSGDSGLYETHTINNNNNKISFPAFSDFNNFEQAQAAAATNNNQFAITNNQHASTGASQYRNNHASATASQLMQHNQVDDFDSFQPIRWRKVEPVGGEQQGNRLNLVARTPMSLVRNANEQPQQQQQQQQHKAIKLTSLPISKELLREIQSVGSMQSLNLGLQQGDFVAMADDLSSMTLPVGHAADRERVLTTPSGSTSAGTLRQVVRDTTDMLNPNELHLGDSNDFNEPTRYSGMTGIVVGWGWVRENDNDLEQPISSGIGSTAGQRSYQSVTLQKVRLPILRNSDCEAWFRSQEKKITLLPSQFCAGFNLGGKDACRGDSGGPMIIEDNSDTGRYKLIGIVSAGIGCARPSLPGLYTRVASFLPWIHAQMQHH